MGEKEATYKRLPSGVEEWYGENGQVIHRKELDGTEVFFEYIANGAKITIKTIDGGITLLEQKKGKVIYSKDKNGNELWYNDNEQIIHFKTKEVEGWTDYDANGRKCHTKDTYGTEEWFYDDGKIVHHSNNHLENWTVYNKFEEEIISKEYINGKPVREEINGKTKWYNDNGEIIDA